MRCARMTSSTWWSLSPMPASFRSPGWLRVHNLVGPAAKPWTSWMGTTCYRRRAGTSCSTPVCTTPAGSLLLAGKPRRSFELGLRGHPHEAPGHRRRRSPMATSAPTRLVSRRGSEQGGCRTTSWSWTRWPDNVIVSALMRRCWGTADPKRRQSTRWSYAWRSAVPSRGAWCWTLWRFSRASFGNLLGTLVSRGRSSTPNSMRTWKMETAGSAMRNFGDTRRQPGGVKEQYLKKAFQKSSLALDFATCHEHNFTFRGREIRQQVKDGVCGHIDVTMRNYALSMQKVTISRARQEQLEQSLNAEETGVLNSAAISRQLRFDLAFENGCVQRCKKDPRVKELVKVKSAIGTARRSADFRWRFWSDVDLENGVFVHLADSGHANGTPSHNGIERRFKSVGGYFLMVANKGLLHGEAVRANIIGFHSSQTKRVCRSTLAAEASHLA